MAEFESNRFSRTDAQTRRAAELRKTGSVAERKLWSCLRARKLGVSFRRQHPVGPYHADFYCAELRLIVEVDGDWHKPLRDQRRDGYMRSRGLETVRIPVPEIYSNLDGVIYGLDAYTAERRLELGNQD